LHGLIIGTSDINKEIKAVLLDNRTIDISELYQIISDVTVFSLNLLLIDEDLEIPGINLTLFGPTLYNIEKRLINLKGSSGKPH